MDQSRFSISPETFYSRVGMASGALVVDVRRAAGVDADDTMLVGAVQRSQGMLEAGMCVNDALSA